MLELEMGNITELSRVLLSLAICCEGFKGDHVKSLLLACSLFPCLINGYQTFVDSGVYPRMPSSKRLGFHFSLFEQNEIEAVKRLNAEIAKPWRHFCFIMLLKINSIYQIQKFLSRCCLELWSWQRRIYYYFFAMEITIKLYFCIKTFS